MNDDRAAAVPVVVDAIAFNADGLVAVPRIMSLVPSGDRAEANDE